MRALLFGTYDASMHPRITAIAEGLRAGGIDVAECNAPLGLDTAARVDMLAHPWRARALLVRLAQRWATLARAARRTPAPDVVLVGYLGHFDVHLARLLFRRVPVVLDHLTGASDTGRDRRLGGIARRFLLRTIDAAALRPGVTWGTNPAQSVTIDDKVPDPSSFASPAQQQAAQRALTYMGLEAGTAIRDIPVDVVFIGSCTNGRLPDLRSAADAIRGRKVSPGVRALVVPGSARVKAEAEAEGLDRVFTDAGFEWRSAGCSMCLGMNGDILTPGQRSASTSNRNFEGRQGPGGRTHLVSPGVAAATAVAGRFTTPGDL